MKLIQLSILFVAMFLLVSCDNVGEAVSNKAQNFAVSTLAEEVNKKTPQMVDQETELYKAAAVGSNLQYHYKLVNYSKAQLDTAFFEKNMKKQLYSSTCENEKLKPLLSLGAGVSYHYVDKNSEALVDFLVTPEDCKAGA